MKRVIISIVTFFVIFSQFSYASNVIGIAEGSKRTGFEQQADGTWKWYIKSEDNYLCNGWKKVDGAQYYFDENGIMATGVTEIDGQYYKFSSDGALIGEATELEYAVHEGDKTAEIGFNPLGETFKMYESQYQEIIDEARIAEEEKVEEEEYKKWLKEVEKEEFLGLNTTIDFNAHTLTSEEQAKVDKAVKEFKNAYIKDEMSDFEKEMMIIQYLVATVKYDYKNYYKIEKNKNYDWPCQTAYGALVKHTCVCAGYADAFKVLGDACGLLTQKVRGATQMSGGGSHAWNMINLDGEWYLVDVTWEDPNETNNYGFGNLRNEWINRTVDDFPRHYTFKNETLEIYDDGTTGKGGGQAQKLDVDCHATKYGPSAVAEYLANYKAQ